MSTFAHIGLSYAFGYVNNFCDFFYVVVNTNFGPIFPYKNESILTYSGQYRRHFN